MTTATVILKPGREKSLHRHHPWVFSGAINTVKDNPAPGATVDVLAADNTWLARGAYSPESQLRVRIWTFDADEQIDKHFFRQRLEQALSYRQALHLSSDAYRWVNGEADGLPGLIVDCYGDYVVCQFSATSSEYWRSTLVSVLQALKKPSGIYERSDLDVRTKEGLTPQQGVLAGASPPELITIQEGQQQFLVDVVNGHKTGFYLDQRDNRACLAELCSKTNIKQLLNCFSYSGAFTTVALQAGIDRITNIDSSAAALALGQRTLELNGLDGQRVTDINGDVFKVLRQFRNENRRFDAIVLDPPKFIESRAQLPRASRGYKDINLLALQLLRPGGFLLTFSCSGLLEPALFQKIVADAALDANRYAHIISRLNQAGDHPTALNFPESHYLKGLLCRVA